ncbi:MAG: hypothetical protein ACXADY_02525 [Candidatus Hodarchaeales archaeon]
MNRKKNQLLAVSVALVALVLMSQSGITHATMQAPKRILADTLIGEDPFIEGLELVAAEDTALIAQYYQLSGEKKFPLDPLHSAFNELDLMYIISSNQANWRDYWPRSIWEFRDGATILFQFSQGMEDSLEDAAEIVTGLETWMETTLDVLYGVEIGGVTTLFYWGYMSPQNHSDFIYDEFYDVLSTGGFTEFITRQTLINAPVSVVGTGLIKNETGYITPLAVAAFILENGIDIGENNVHNMSIGSAFGFSGMIQPAPNSIISNIKFELPYVANVYDSYPDTNNLYPELTGQFEWTLKAGSWIDTSYEDVYVTYNMAVEELETFPQISSDVSVDVGALHSPTDPMLNYTIEMNNTGDETAYDVSFTWDLQGKPESMNIPIFNSGEYEFNSTIQKYYNYFNGTLDDVPAWNATKPINLLIEGWFTYTNGTVVQPVTHWNTTENAYDLDLEASMKAVYINKSFFEFNYSSNLQETTLENGNFALNGTIGELTNGSAEIFWWSIGELPAIDDTFMILGWDASVNVTTYPLEFNVTFFDNTSSYGVGNNLADYVVREALSKGQDLRHPSLIGDPEFLPGVMFRYSDSADREYFGWSNSLVVQLYDDEAILKATVSLNSSIYKIDDIAQIDVSIENIGDAKATNIFIQGYHAQLGPDWELRDIYNFSEVTSINDIISGGVETHTFYRNVSTFLGLHPVAIGLAYTTEEDESYGGALNRTEVKGLASNLIIALVLPKDDKAGKDEPSYPTPVVNVSVSWTDENGGDIENGDLIEIRTEVKNLGDEATTIKLFSYFPTRMASIDVYAQYYEEGKNFKVTDESGNLLTGYDTGYAMDNPDWPITIAAVAGLHLVPEATIVFYYKLTVTDASSLIIPPVHVEYDSRYPMAGTSGMKSSSEETGETSPVAIGMSLNTRFRTELSSPRFSIQAEDSSSSSWTSYSGSSLLSAYAAAVEPEESSEPSTPSTSGPPTSETGGVNGFTTLTSFINENMRLMIVVLAIPILVLSVRELRRTKK